MAKNWRERIGAGLLAGAGLLGGAAATGAPDAPPAAAASQAAASPEVKGSVYEYLSSLPERKKFDNEAQKFFYDMGRLVRQDAAAREEDKPGLIPDAVALAMANTPAGKVILSPSSTAIIDILADGNNGLRVGTLMQTAIEDKKLAFLRDYPDFSLLVFGAEVAAALVQKRTDTPEGLARENIIHQTRIASRAFTDKDGNLLSFDKMPKENSVYPASHRAADSISQADTHPWSRALQRPDGLHMPYSFNNSQTPPVLYPSIFRLVPSIRETVGALNGGKQFPLTSERKDAALFALQKFAEPARITFQEFDRLPNLVADPDLLFKGLTPEKPHGLLMTSSTLPHIELFAGQGKKPTQGVAVRDVLMNWSSLNDVRMRSDVRVHTDKDDCLPQTILHELGHGIANFSHPFSPAGNFQLPGTKDSITPGITRNETVMSYTAPVVTHNGKYLPVCQVSLMPGDIIALQRLYGAREQQPRTYSLQSYSAPLAEKLAASEKAVLVDAETPLAQTLLGPTGSTLDFSRLNGEPVSLASLSTLMLGRPENQLSFAKADGTQLAPTLIYTMQPITNAVLHEGTVRAAPQGGRIELQKQGLIIDDSGNNLMVGGTDRTAFMGAQKAPNRYVMRAGENKDARDTLIDPLAADTLVAPEGSAYALSTSFADNGKCNQELTFHTKDDRPIKNLGILAERSDCITPAIEQPDGTPLPVHSAPVTQQTLQDEAAPAPPASGAHAARAKKSRQSGKARPGR